MRTLACTAQCVQCFPSTEQLPGTPLQLKWSGQPASEQPVAPAEQKEESGSEDGASIAAVHAGEGAPEEEAPEEEAPQGRTLRPRRGRAAAD